MEDHLLEIFGGHEIEKVEDFTPEYSNDITWTKNASDELNRIPGFVRGKVKRKTESFAKQNGIDEITLEVIYAAKENSVAA